MITGTLRLPFDPVGLVPRIVSIMYSYHIKVSMEPQSQSDQYHRVTAPMQSFQHNHVVGGLIALLIGLVIVLAIPLLL